MNKNFISVFLIIFFIISCSNNEKQSVNKNKKTVVVTTDKSDLQTIKKVENFDKILVRESTELNSVSPDQLKVDGG